ncbi:hypothetical protein ACFX2I_024771 [Malus domestica]
MDVIGELVLWARLPKLPLQYKEDKIIKTIAQPLGDIIRVDDVTLNLNGLFVKVLVKVDLRFLLKSDLVVNGDDKNPILVSYEKIFEVCFYYGSWRNGNHYCPEEEVDDGCFMIDRVFYDEPKIFLEDIQVEDDIKEALQSDVLLCFPVAMTQDEENLEAKERVQKIDGEDPNDEGWKTVIPRWCRKADKKRASEKVWEDNVVGNVP